MNFILSKFKGKCAETGTPILKNEGCLFDRATKKVYCKTSKKYKDELENAFSRSFTNA